MHLTYKLLLLVLERELLPLKHITSILSRYQYHIHSPRTQYNIYKDDGCTVLIVLAHFFHVLTCNAIHIITFVKHFRIIYF